VWGSKIFNQEFRQLIYIDDFGTPVSPEQKVESNKNGAKHSREKHVHTIEVRHLDIVFVIYINSCDLLERLPYMAKFSIIPLHKSCKVLGSILENSMRKKDIKWLTTFFF